MTGVDAVIRKPRRLTAVSTIQWISLIQNLSSGDEPPLKESKLQTKESKLPKN